MGKSGFWTLPNINHNFLLKTYFNCIFNYTYSIIVYSYPNSLKNCMIIYQYAWKLIIIRYVSQILFIFLFLDAGNTSLTKTYQLYLNWCTLIIFVYIILHTYCNRIFSFHYYFTFFVISVAEKFWVSKNIIVPCGCDPLAMENAHSGWQLVKPAIELKLNKI